MTTEQRTSLKFLVRLGKSLTEVLSTLQQIYKVQTLSRATFFCGIIDSKKDVRMLRMTPGEMKPMLNW